MVAAYEFAVIRERFFHGKRHVDNKAKDEDRCITATRQAVALYIRALVCLAFAAHILTIPHLTDKGGLQEFRV